MQNPLLKSMKIGFIGAGNMTHALIKGILETKAIRPQQILVSNRTPGKLLKLSEHYQIQTREQNEEVVEECDIIILAMKPQDLFSALEGFANQIRSQQIVVSLAAGINFSALSKIIPEGRLIRLMPNTPVIIGQGILGYICEKPSDDFLATLMEDLFSSLGLVIEVDSEDQFDSLMVSCSSGTGFVFELMMYWQDWIEERGFSEELAKQMTIETFLGAAMLAAQSTGVSIEELQSRVTSKKGVTASGLSSMRELEIERTLRISFEKAALRSKELSKI